VAPFEASTYDVKEETEPLVAAVTLNASAVPAELLSATEDTVFVPSKRVEPPLPACTTRDEEEEWARLPLEPVTVIVEVPAGVVPEVETVSVDDAPATTLAGAKLALAPEGRPPALNAMVPLNPLRAVVETV
jgi:hypothetical protein